MTNIYNRTGPSKKPQKRLGPMWKRQRRLQKEHGGDAVPDLADLNQIINSIDVGKIDKEYQTLRARALFALYYLTACRCKEVLMITSNTKQKVINDKILTVKRIRYPGITRKDFKIKVIHGKKYLKILCYNLKNKNRTKKVLLCPVEKEQIIMQHLKRYFAFVKRNKTFQTKTLFPFTQQRAIQLLTLTTGINLHFIRHIRATHLVTMYNFSDQLLVRFMGWTDSRPAKHYLELRVQDFADRFEKSD